MPAGSPRKPLITMLTNKLALIFLSVMIGAEAKRSLYSSSSSESTSRSTSATTTSGSSSSSSSSSDGFAYYTDSSKSSKSGSSESTSDDASRTVEGREGYKAKVVNQCLKKEHTAIVVNMPFCTKLVRVFDYFHNNSVKASFVVNGADLTTSLNKHAKAYRKIVKNLYEDGHTIVVKPDNLKPIKDMNAREVVRAVEVSAYAIEKVIGVSPLFVHITGGLPHTPKGKQIAALLRHKGFVNLGWSKSITEQGKGLKSLRRHRNKKSSRKDKKKNRRNRRKSSSSSTDITTSTTDSSSWQNEISSSTHSTDSTSTTSSSSDDKHRRRRHRRHHRKSKTAKGHIFYAQNQRHVGEHIQKTVESLTKKGYKIVSLARCTKKTPYFKEAASTKA